MWQRWDLAPMSHEAHLGCLSFKQCGKGTAQGQWLFSVAVLEVE